MNRLVETFLIFAGIGCFAVPNVAVAANGPEQGHMWGNWGAGHMTFGILPMALFWLFLVVFIVMLIRWTTKDSITPNRPTDNTALYILKERFARGEIDKKEFEESKRVLID